MFNKPKWDADGRTGERTSGRTQADERTSGRADERTSGRAGERTSGRADERQILKKKPATEISPPRAHTQLRIARTKRKRKSFPVGTTPQPPIYIRYLIIFFHFSFDRRLGGKPTGKSFRFVRAYVRARFLIVRPDI